MLEHRIERHLFFHEVDPAGIWDVIKGCVKHFLLEGEQPKWLMLI